MISDGVSICRANQWTDFFMKGTSVMKELKTNTVIKQKEVNCFAEQLN